MQTLAVFFYSLLYHGRKVVNHLHYLITMNSVLRCTFIFNLRNETGNLNEEEGAPLFFQNSLFF